MGTEPVTFRTVLRHVGGSRPARFGICASSYVPVTLISE